MMNVRKHVAGFALFTVILGSAIIVNNVLTYPNVTIPYARPDLPFSTREETSQAVDYKVRLVSLDFINKQSYTALALERRSGQPVPESLWVTNYFFSPQYPGRVWTSRVEILQPFARFDRIDHVTTASCDFCSDTDAPRAGYFARVSVSAGYPDQAYPAIFDRDIATAEHVVVQAERNVAPPVAR